MGRLGQSNEASLAEQARAAIQTAILKGTLAPGERVPVAHIAEELGISRTPVREALKALEGDGLIENQPYRGAVVKTVAGDDVFHRLSAWALLEGYAASVACQIDGAGVAERLQGNLTEARSIAAGIDARSANGARRLVRLDQAFHAEIAAGSASPSLESALDRLRKPETLVLDIWERADSRAEAIAQHQAIATAFGAGDPDAVKELVEAHLCFSRDRAAGRVSV